jgi:hypothetical protein
VALLVAGCGRGKSAKPSSSSGDTGGQAARPHMSGGPLDPAARIAAESPQKRAQEFRDSIKSPMKKSIAEIAKKYLDDPDPDVKAAANELVNAAQ